MYKAKRAASPAARFRSLQARTDLQWHFGDLDREPGQTEAVCLRGVCFNFKQAASPEGAVHTVEELSQLLSPMHGVCTSMLQKLEDMSRTMTRTQHWQVLCMAMCSVCLYWYSMNLLAHTSRVTVQTWYDLCAARGRRVLAGLRAPSALPQALRAGAWRCWLVACARCHESR